MKNNLSASEDRQRNFGGSLQSTDLFSSPSVGISMRSGIVHRPIVYAEPRPIDWCFLYFVRRGTVAIRQSTIGRWRVVAANSLFFVRQPSDLILQVARGEVDLIVIQWSRRLTVGIEEWLIQNWSRKRKSSVATYCSGHITDYGILPIIDHHTSFDSIRTEMRLLGKVHELMGDLLTQETELCLAPLPVDLPDPIFGLIEKVRLTPAKTWTLKQAADLAGYSPFHLSRTFKHHVGYGFPDFVLRCRSEIAVKLLCNTNRQVDAIRLTSGFSSIQAMREALKEFLGFLPSELRMPGESDAGSESEG